MKDQDVINGALLAAYMQDAADFIAGRVFPVVPVEKQSDKYFTWIGRRPQVKDQDVINEALLAETFWQRTRSAEVDCLQEYLDGRMRRFRSGSKFQYTRRRLMAELRRLRDEITITLTRAERNGRECRADRRERAMPRVRPAE